MASAVRAPRTVLPTLLLFVLVSGVVAMHSLGHPGTGHHAASLTFGPAPEPMSQPMAAAPRISIRAAVEVGAHTGHPGAREQGLVALAPTGVPGMDPFDVCLAVLTAFGLAALLRRLLLTARSRAGAGSVLPGALAVAGRSPPQRLPVGLVLADLSVLRR